MSTTVTWMTLTVRRELCHDPSQRLKQACWRRLQAGNSAVSREAGGGIVSEFEILDKTSKTAENAHTERISSVFGPVARACVPETKK